MKLFLKVAFILLCLYWLPQALYGQTDSLLLKAETLRESGKLQEALPLYYQYQGQNLGKLSIREDATLAYKIAACYFNLSDYDSTVKYMKYALTQKEKILDRSDTFLLSAHAVMGYIYRYEKPDIRKAASHFDDQRSIMDAYPEKFKPLQMYNNYFNLASANRELKDYDRALNYAYQALSSAQKLVKQPRLKENCYLLIANSLSGKKLYEQADEFYQKKLSTNILQRGKKHPSLALDYYSLAMNQTDQNNLNEAIKNFKLAEQIALEYDQPLLSNIYRGMGVSYGYTGNKELSIQYLYKSLPLAYDRPMHKAWTYRQIAFHYEQKQQYDSAYNNYQKAFQTIITDFNWETNLDNPSLTKLTISNPYVYTILELKANCLLQEYRTTQNFNSLKAAASAYDLLDQLTDQYRNNLILESSRLFFQEKNHKAYENALEVNYLLYQQKSELVYLENCWKLIEKNKSILLLENLLSAEKEIGMKLPDSIRDAKRFISERLLKAQTDIQLCESSGTCNESRLITLRDSLRVNETLFRENLEHIKSQFTKYYNFTEDREIISIKNLQSCLSEKQIILNYFESDEFYYLVTIDKTTTSLGRVPRDEVLSKTLNNFLLEISGETLRSNGILNAYNTFSQAAYALYNSIIPEKVKIGNLKDLVIIPDGKLAGVPFEALIQNLPKVKTKDFSQLNYLIRDYSINYGFSATLWHKNVIKKPTVVRNKLVAFGANSADRPELTKLSAVNNEVNYLKTLDNSYVFAEASATENNFKKTIGDASIIHLALHNINDYENPLNSRLIFSIDTTKQDSDLFLYEIFNVPMNPSLVVLSGCETGVGKWLKGEGAYHIGRGFLYHGNPSMIMSLWKVRDASTAKIMEGFYDELQDKSSSEAIRNAKLSFLNSADPLTAHPSNWAAFVGIGQVSLSTSKSNLTWLWFAIGIILLVVIKKAVRKSTSYQTA